MAEPGTPPAGGMNDTLREEITQMMGGVVNNMLTARLKTFEKQLHEKVGLSINESLTKTLDEKLASFKPAEKMPEEEGGGKGGKKSEKENAEMATLRKQMETLQAKADASERQSAQLRERARETALREQASKFLANAGIVGDRFDAAYAKLVYDRKLKPSEDSDSDENFYVDATGEMALEVGLGSWLKTEQAKIFLPPSGTRGSGSRPSSGMPNGQKPTPDQIRSNIAAALERELGK